MKYCILRRSDKTKERKAEWPFALLFYQKYISPKYSGQWKFGFSVGIGFQLR